MLEICIRRQIKSAVANEYLIPYNVIKRATMFYLGRELLFIDLKLSTHSKYLKNVQRSNKNVCDMTFLLKSSYINNLSR